MAASDFQRSLTRVLVYEGGRVDDPQDPGGRTNQGVTQGTYDAYRRSKDMEPRDVFVINSAEVGDIYKSMYWDVLHCDQLPVGLDLCVFDAGVNSGTGRAGKWLQQALGSAYSGQIDGRLGMKTFQAIQDFGDVEKLIDDFCQHRLGTLKRLPTFKRFGKGWSARIANVRKIADAWAANDDSFAPHPVDVKSAGGQRKALIDDSMTQPAVSPIVTHVVTGAGSIGTVATQTAQQVAAVSVDWDWLKYACAGLTLAGIAAGIIVKFGMDAKNLAESGAAKAEVDPDADAPFPTVEVKDPAPPADAPPPAPPAPAAKA